MWTKIAVSLVILLNALAATAWCQDDNKNPAAAVDAPRKNWSEAIKKSAEQIEVFASADDNEPLKMIAAYKWRNPARPNVLGERLCLLYVHEGRPVASCKVYPTGQSIVHTFISFADLPLVARHREAVVWTPPRSAPTFVELDDVEPPHGTPNRRRVQLKSLVREFSMLTGPGEAARQSAAPELRLLPQPLYRYDINDDGQEGLVDGAAFCFVANGGNPQALLMIEAIRTGDTLRWRYGFSRRTYAKLEAFHKKREVWSVDFLPLRRRQSTDTFFNLNLPTNE